MRGMATAVSPSSPFPALVLQISHIGGAGTVLCLASLLHLARRNGGSEPVLRASHPPRVPSQSPPAPSPTHREGSTQEPSKQGSYVPYQSGHFITAASSATPGNECPKTPARRRRASTQRPSREHRDITPEPFSRGIAPNRHPNGSMALPRALANSGTSELLLPSPQSSSRITFTSLTTR